MVVDGARLRVRRVSDVVAISRSPNAPSFKRFDVQVVERGTQLKTFAALDLTFV